MRERLSQTAQFLKENQWTLLTLLFLAADTGVFIGGIILLSMGSSLPSGEVYECDKEDFQLITSEHDPLAFYRSLRGNCNFLSLCVANFTSTIMTLLCAKPCETLFVSTNITDTNTTDVMLVRACSVNQDTGLGTMMTVWSGIGLFGVLLCACCCMNALCKPLADMRESFHEIFFENRPPPPLLENNSFRPYV